MEQRAERRAELLRRVADAVLAGDGALEPGVRAAILQRAAGDPSPVVTDGLGAFVDKVIERAYTVTDTDVDALRAAGFTEDAIFEAVVATAVGAGLARLDAGMAALAGKE